MRRNGAIRLPCGNSLQFSVCWPRCHLAFYRSRRGRALCLEERPRCFLRSLGKPKQLLSIPPKAIKHHFSLKGLFSLSAALRWVVLLWLQTRSLSVHFMGICGQIFIVFAFLLTIKDNYFTGKTNCVVIWIRSLNQREPWIAKTAKM